MLLGEDEMAPRNRIVLICSRCRLVNGQAPPGTKSLCELGTWKCMACGTANNEVDKRREMLRELMEEEQKDVASTAAVKNGGYVARDAAGEDFSHVEKSNNIIIDEVPAAAEDQKTD